MMQSAFKPVMVLLAIVGGVSAWIVNEAQDELLLNVFVELLSVATSCEVIPVQPLNMELYHLSAMVVAGRVGACVRPVQP